MRLLAVVAVWVLASVAALAVAWQTRVGRVAFVVSSTHGVHWGDLAAFVVAYAWAVVITMAIVAAPRR